MKSTEKSLTIPQKLRKKKKKNSKFLDTVLDLGIET